jgi:hypothetical protein
MIRMETEFVGSGREAAQVLVEDLLALAATQVDPGGFHFVQHFLQMRLLRTPPNASLR